MSGGTGIRVATFNLFSGRRPIQGPNQGPIQGPIQGAAAGAEPSAEEAELAAAIGHLGADVLAIQEVDRDQPRSGLSDQTAVVAAAMGLGDPTTGSPGPGGSRFVRTVRGTPGEATVWPAEGPAPAYGIGLVSRVPVAEWHELRLAPPRGRFPLPIPSRPPRLLWLPEEPRAAVAVVLHEPRITVACTHLSFVPGVNVHQLRQVRRWLLGLPGPRILLGDLNLPGGLPARLTGWRALATAPTFPSFGPRVQLDHVLTDATVAELQATGSARRLQISDHLALTADLHFPR